MSTSTSSPATPAPAPSAYSQLITQLREIALLGSTMSVLGWDEQTYMPHGGAALRADQVSLLARLSHQRITSPEFADLLAAAEAEHPSADPHSCEGTNLRQVRRSFDRASKLPTALVEELSRTAVMSEQAWASARKSDTFADFLPWLTKMVELKRQEATHVGAPSGELYDALLDEYEPGMTAANLRQIFGELKEPVAEIVRQIAESGKVAPVELLRKHYPAAGQECLSRRAAAAFGFNFDEGRLDVSVHPFCTMIGPGDTRMTTRYDENDIGNAFFSVLHETGHGLYDQGLPKEHFGTPCGEYVSLGIHESQSRLWENLVGRNHHFWTWMWPQFREIFPDALRGVKQDEWLFAVNAVQPSFIRTESDEITYNLHIILRFELEQALLTGDLAPADLPGAWSDAMQRLLGVRPTCDREGCLQDVHWSGGGIGYFPTYTLGNLIAAQLYEAACQQITGLEDGIATGNFLPLLKWLRHHIHQHGQRYTSTELIQRATGKPLSAAPLLAHLRHKADTYYLS